MTKLEEYLEFRTYGKMRVLDFGYKVLPIAGRKGDAAYDVHCVYERILERFETAAIPLGFGLEMMPNAMGLVLPRGGMAKQGILVHCPPIDSYYKGEIHAIITNLTKERLRLCVGDRIAQLVVLDIYSPTKWRSNDERGEQRFGSSGR